MSHTKSGKGRKSAKFTTLPPNPVYLDFKSSDGDSHRWPSQTHQHRTVDHLNQINWYRYIGPDEPEAIRWRVEVGTGAAAVLQLPPGQNYVLRGWPNEYAFYCHEKGKAESPRRDHYLIGHRMRFRSTKEFIEHAAWLISGAVNPCKCKNCSGRPQTEVSRDLAANGIKTRASPSKASSAGPITKRSPSKTPAKPSTSRVRTSMPPPPPPMPLQPSPVELPPSPPPAPTLPAQPTAAEPPPPQIALLCEDPASSSSDLIHTQRAIELNEALVPDPTRMCRWYRSGEVVWAQLDPPLSGEGPPIIFWPCVVTSTAAEIPYSDTLGYQVRCIVVDHARDIFPGHRLLPYLAFSPSALVDWALEQTPAELDFPHSELENFQPFAPCENYKLAVSACVHAIQVGAQLADFWAPDMVTIPTPPPLHTPSPPLGLPNPSPSPAPTQPPVNSAHLLSAMTRCQGIWWGPERIWAGDLVRLRLPRSGLAPQGVDHVLPPSPLGKAGLDYLAKLGLTPDTAPGPLGVLTRATFLRIARIGPPTATECCAAGVLYELADEDVGPGVWDDVPDAPLPTEPTGFRWRRITEPGFVASVPLPLLAGRYYARMLKHPLLDHVMATPQELTAENPVVSLEGLMPAGNIETDQFQPDRGLQLARAKEEAFAMLRTYFEGGDADADGEDDNEVDQLAEEEVTVGIFSEVHCSVDGCDLPVDVVFKSSDGELLGAHSRNLEMYGEGFPAAPNGVADPEPASLTEPAKTLRTLLAFMHLVPQPRIRNLSCKSVLEIAEAAEKYGVHSATQVCAIVLESKGKECPSDVLRFALRHGYKELANTVAPYTLEFSVAEMKSMYKDDDYALMKWLLYCSRWEDLTRRAAKPTHWRVHRGGKLHCDDWQDFWIPVLGDLITHGKNAIYGGQLQSIVDSHLYQLDDCEYCCPDVRFWVNTYEKEAQKLVEEGIIYHDRQCTILVKAACPPPLARPMSSSTTPTQAPTPPVCGVKDCTLPVDLILKSSDGKLLGAHACNLATYGEAFPCVDGTVVASEPLNLTENKATLKTLLAFMHLAPQPKIRNLPCSEVLELAEAAEKYGVHSATQVCAIVLESKVASKPASILKFALKHGHGELANAAAPHTLGFSTSEMTEHYKGDDYALMKWLLYCARWEELTRNASKKNSWRIHRGGSAHCEYWASFWAAVLGDLLSLGKAATYGGKLRSLVEARLCMLHGCEYCTPDVKHWVSTWEQEAVDLASRGIM
ncbi:hypothetical protein EV714DRAFT_203362 [Schizophyllum commune]